MCRAHELASGREYDWLVRLRPDLVLGRPLPSLHALLLPPHAALEKPVFFHAARAPNASGGLDRTLFLKSCGSGNYGYQDIFAMGTRWPMLRYMERLADLDHPAVRKRLRSGKWAAETFVTMLLRQGYGVLMQRTPDVLYTVMRNRSCGGDAGMNCIAARTAPSPAHSGGS